MDLKVWGVEFVAQSQVSLQFGFAPVEVGALFASVLHQDSQLIPLLSELLQRPVFSKQLLHLHINLHPHQGKKL